MPQKKIQTKKNNISSSTKNTRKKATSKKPATQKTAAASEKRVASSSNTRKIIRTKHLERKAKSLDELLEKDSRIKVKKNIARELLERKRIKKSVNIYSSPYAYVYADYLKDIKNAKPLRAIENRLTDLGISGRIHKLSQFKNLEEIVREDMRRGITTVVMVGDDKMIEKGITIAANLGIILGAIPLGKENRIAQILGIPEGVAACDTLSQRIVEQLDYGEINGRPFVSQLDITSQKIPLICDNQYEILSYGAHITIYNLSLNREDGFSRRVNPKDGKFDILVRPKRHFGSRLFGKKEDVKNSLFFAKKIGMISNSAFSIYVDGKKNSYKKVEIKVIPKGLKIIVGKGRGI